MSESILNITNLVKDYKTGFTGKKTRVLRDVSFDVRWDDILGDVTQGTATGALTYEQYRDTGHLAYHFRHDQDDALYHRFQFSHRWNRGAVKPHIHWVPCVNPASPQVVQFYYAYAWASPGVEVPAATGWVSAEVSATVGTSDAFKPKITALVTITPPADTPESAFLLLTVKRLGSSSGSDTYTTSKGSGTGAANVALLGVDVHYQSEKIGTTAEIPT